jgi:aspartate aminotransferase-like enzyme
MARKTNLKKAAIKIGTAVGKADRAAHRLGRVGVVAKEEILELIEQVDDLKQQLEKAAKRLKNAVK